MDYLCFLYPQHSNDLLCRLNMQLLSIGRKPMHEQYCNAYMLGSYVKRSKPRIYDILGLLQSKRDSSSYTINVHITKQVLYS